MAVFILSSSHSRADIISQPKFKTNLIDVIASVPLQLHQVLRLKMYGALCLLLHIIVEDEYRES